MLDIKNMSKEQLQETIAKLQAEKKERPKELFCKVSAKGAMSLYGLGRFPVTLYYQQWQKVLASVNNITQFLEENKAQFSVKTK